MTTISGPVATPTGLRAALAAGRFVATVETTPPVSADPRALLDKVACLKGLADAVNLTDGAAARSHMSSLAAAALLVRAGLEPILQMTVRDRNRIALQGDLLGAAALGVRNILCLTGDDVATGDQPDAKMVFDLDSAGLMALARDMRDTAELPTGRAIAGAPDLLIGGTESVLAPAPAWSPARLLAKLDAGARFFQTQFCFEPEVARLYFTRLGELGILERAHFIVGLGPLRSAKSARWMNDNLWGVHIPDPVIHRLEGAADAAAEGVRVCCELIEAFRAIPGIAGVHLMGRGLEAASAEVIAESGLGAARATA